MICIKLSKAVSKATIYDYATTYGYAAKSEIASVKKYALDKKCSPARAFLDTGVMTESDLLKLQGQIYNYKIIEDIRKVSIDENVTAKFDSKKMMELKMIPFKNDSKLEVMITEPVNSVIIEDYIWDVLGRATQIEFYIVSEAAYTHCINSSTTASRIEYDLEQLQPADGQDNQAYDITGTDTGTIINLANKILFKATQMKASDIHIEPFDNRTRIRLRIDGLLQNILEPPKQIHSQLVNRIKTMANMNINTTRIFQGGGIRLTTHGSHIDVRVSSLPTVYGEKIVMRLLDNDTSFDINNICFSDENKQKFLNCIKKPSGIVLMTGPTGSGKSTTLYAAIAELNSEHRSVVTVEDPIEFKIDGITQVQVHHEIGRTFPACLREVLRQDPDIILIGEIRDKETAATAMAASNTGHLIFSTLHTNDAVSAVTRLIEMGVEPFMVSSTINGIVSQRLVRRICERCKTEYSIDKNSRYYNIITRMLPEKQFGDKIVLFNGRGCVECGNIGYKGRIAVHEFLVMNDGLREAISTRSSSGKLQKLAVQNGMSTIFEDGITKVLAGLTTLDEIHRVLHFDGI